jgi:hypothetical protein
LGFWFIIIITACFSSKANEGEEIGKICVGTCLLFACVCPDILHSARLFVPLTPPPSGPLFFSEGKAAAAVFFFFPEGERKSDPVTSHQNRKDTAFFFYSERKATIACQTTAVCSVAYFLMAEFVSLMKKNFRERKKMMRWSITLSLFLAEKKNK